MKQLAYTCVLGFILSLTLGASFAYGDDHLGKTELETLIKGNTVEGKKVRWNTTYKMYFDPSGRWKRIDSLNNKEKGRWSVDDKGFLLISGRKEFTRIVKKRTDGGYDLCDRIGHVLLTMDKVVPGNPYNLEP